MADWKKKIADWFDKHPILLWGVIVGYILFPTDLIPDVPVVGMIDDVIVTLIGAYFTYYKK